jgi:hypothetical protein
MCDPTVLAIGSTIAGVAGQAANYFGQQSAQNKQEDAYNEWAAQQSKNRALENSRQEGFRKDAQAAQQQGLQDVGADAQKRAQETEEQRLGDYLQGKDQQAAPDPSAPISIADKTLSGQQDTGAGPGDQFQSDLATKINQATAASKQRIQALARVSSYGGSQGGLDTVTSEALRKSGSGIDVTNDLRRGSLGAYGIEQAVNPKQISYTPSPLAGVASSLFSIGTQGLGSMFAGNAATPTVTGSGSTPQTMHYGGIPFTRF